MKLGPVIAHLRCYAPLFAQRVAGAAEMVAAQDSAHLTVPHAFVVATGDEAQDNTLQNGTRQVIHDTFDVVVVLAPGDARGQQAADAMHDVRVQLHQALVGWSPSGQHDPLEYRGAELVSVDRSRAWYRFAFAASWVLGEGEPPDTWHDGWLARLPAFEEANVRTEQRTGFQVRWNDDEDAAHQAG